MTIKKEISIISNNLRGVKNQIIRKRAILILMALKSDNKKFIADKYGCSRQKIYYWLNRLRHNNYNIQSLQNLSRKPKSNSRRIKQGIIDLILQVRKQNADCGAQKIAYLMKHKNGVFIHASTIGYILQRQDISKRYRIPRKNKHKRRYSLKTPLERVQTDTTNLNLVDNFGHKVKAYPVIDDCTRMVSVHIANEHSGYEAKKGIEKFFINIGIPKSVQTDNGTEFTNYYNSLTNPKRNKPPTLSCFEILLQENNIYHKLIRPATPQLNGKVERFNQTFKRECISKLKNGMTIKQIQEQVDKYLLWYNKKRIHASLNYLTPCEKFQQVQLE